MTAGAGERGTVTAFVVVVTTALLAMAALVHDGAGLIATKRLAVDQANAAARAGAQAVDESALRSGRVVRVEPGAAAAAARRYLAGSGYRGTVRVRGDRVEVTVTIAYRPEMLRVIGARRISGAGSARLVRGVTGAET
jgi:hypothetical protein